MVVSDKLRQEGLLKYTDSLPFPAIVIDSEFNVLLVNRRGAETFEAAEHRGKCYELTHGIDKPCWEVFGENVCPVKKLAEQKDPYAYHEHTGEEFHLLVASRVDEDLYMEFFLDSYISDIIRQLRFLADIDSLTGFYNRRKIEEILQGEMARSKRYGDPLSVIFIDIDNFKHINDTFGHRKGDEVLRKVADLIRREIRKTDSVGRFGGEEFVIVLPETDPERAVRVAERIRERIEREDFGVGEVTVSVGVTGLKGEDDYGSLFVRMDRAMYLAKKKGKNRVEILR